MRQALAAADRILRLGGDPLSELLLGHDPAEDDAVDPNVPRPELAREGVGETFDTGLSRDVGRQLQKIDVRTDRTHVDD